MVPAIHPTAGADSDVTVRALDEVAVLWPRLLDALPRDRAGDDGVRTSAAGVASPSRGGPATTTLVNQDVARAQALIAAGCSQIAAEAVRLLNLTPRPRSTAATIADLRLWYPQLRDVGSHSPGTSPTTRSAGPGPPVVR